MLRHGIGVCVVMCLVAGCGDKKTPAGPSNTNAQVAGVWRGTIVNITPPGPNGSVLFTLAQNATAVSGTWGTSYADSSLNNSGSAGGSVSGQSMSLTLEPSNPTYCPYRVTAALSGNFMSGTFAAFNCSVPVSGSFSAAKQ